MVSLHLKDIVKRFDDVAAVAGVNVKIGKGELFFLLGPSGCGKSTLLRTIAGFYDPEEGQVIFDDRDVTKLPPYKRNTGMVFQNYALWPHMTVEDNVAYGLDVRKVRGSERSQRIAQALEMVHMAEYGKRRPNQLSGGQQQRVALARALVIEPDVILLDEPLSNLDAKLRLEMRDEIKRIHSETGITTIYVTHDQKEALSMADRLAVMDAGKVIQIGSPQEVYRRPANRFVAKFIGETNLLEGTIAGRDGATTIVTTEIGDIKTTGSEAPGKVWCSIRPEAFRLIRNDIPENGNTISATVKGNIYLGEMEQYEFESNGITLRVVELNPLEAPKVGSRIALTVSPEDVVLLK
ncbi:MAG: ABC transporter ATP-binding protein [Planctomycetota bacterium]|nr:ABC transporter ATP-binding protein [Planctomycetota bacterium]MDA1142829.1 ABC transporter ATP-binding protein [Planctomycetota bacterium]